MPAPVQLTEEETAELAEKVAGLAQYADDLLQKNQSLQEQLETAQGKLTRLEGDRVHLEKVAGEKETMVSLAHTLLEDLQSERFIRKEAAAQLRDTINADNAQQHTRRMFQALMQKAARVDSPGDLVPREPASETNSFRPADPHGDFAFLYKK